MAGELVTLEVDPASLREFNDALLLWKAMTGKSWSDVLRKGGRLLCVSFARSTQPYGDNNSARQQGQVAVARDIGRVYVTINQIFQKIDAVDQAAAKGFYKAIRTANYPKAREIMHAFGLTQYEQLPIGPFDKTLHNDLRFRNRRGRIPRSTKPKLIVTNAAALRIYQKQMVARVGYAKSSWATCADQLGGARGIPQWAKRWRAPGRVQDHSKAEDPSVVITSDVKFMDVALPDAERDRALEISRNRMEKEMRIAMEVTARKALAA